MPQVEHIRTAACMMTQILEQSLGCILDCSKRFNSKESLDVHKEKGDHDGAFFFSCDQCPKKFSSTKDMRNHMCGTILQDCFKEPAENSKQQDRMEAKQDNEELSVPFFNCQICGYTLPSTESLEIHNKIHIEQTSISCKTPQCLETFATEKEYKAHILATHGLNTKIYCENCGKMFKNLYELKPHMRTHNPEKNFICVECGKRFKREQNMKIHTLGFHKGIFNYNCDECGMNLVSRVALHGHKRNKHNQEYVFCPECNQRLRDKYKLDEHMTIHTGEKKYKCKTDGCGKKFRIDSVLRNHEKLHTGVKEYQCIICPKKFRQSQHLSNHIKRHKGIKDFKCETCGKEFIEPAGARHCKHSIANNRK